MNGIDFNPMAFVDNLIYMGAGMFSILLVIALIIGVVLVLNALTKPRDKKKKAD